eukprot:TRINITY_DN235_c0_g1_i1.p1 TRINITY_DN235_c0_g1~~TRINITY_DN235_c0_g1_i1.p1  ORF type:complete len:259 (+),score=25.14 TRINITY_DN235_c0_g1_i1:84-860(+)
MRFGGVLLLALAGGRSAAEDTSAASNASNLRGVPEPTPETQAPNLLEMPDVSGPLDHPGPYEEEPIESDAEKPQNATLTNLPEAEFCNVHQTGFWCNTSTRVRCCKLKDGSYAKCGSALNSMACGLPAADATLLQNASLGAFSTWWSPPYWGGGGDNGNDRRRDDRRRESDRRRDDRRRDDRRRDDRRRDDRRRDNDRRRYGGGGGSWHIHPGWHVSTFCQTHHVGQFCSSHRIIHCCNDYGHWVECNTDYHHGSWYC